MSRIGKKPINIIKGVEVKLNGNILVVKGPKGEITQEIHPQVKIEITPESILVTVNDPEEKNQRALWGLFASLIDNMMTGVTQGFEKKMEVVGIGYKVNLQGNKIVLNVGFSHPVEFVLPAGISAAVEKNFITLNGIDKQVVGEVAAKLRRIRKPEPYKGKGIKYADEILKKKAGKTAAKTS